MSAFVAAVLAMASTAAACWPIWRQTWADAHHPLDPRSPAEPAVPVGRHAVARHWRWDDLYPHTPTHLIGAA